MGKIDLVRDPRTRFFVLPAFVVRNEVGGQPGPNGEPYLTLEMIVDTGSNLTNISGDTAGKLGYDLHHLSREGAGGIGGFSSQPIVPNFTIWVQDVSGPYRVRLPKVAVMEDRTELVTVREGVLKGHKKRILKGVDLFALDGLEALKAALTVEPGTGRGAITW